MRTSTSSAVCAGPAKATEKARLLQEEGLSHRAVVNDERNPAVQPAPHRPAADPAQQLLVAEHEPRLAADILDVDKEQPGALGDELRKPLASLRAHARPSQRRMADERIMRGDRDRRHSTCEEEELARKHSGKVLSPRNSY